MTLIEVTIESAIAGPCSGFERVCIENDKEVQDIIGRFCAKKGISSNSCYVLRDKRSRLLKPTDSIKACGIMNNDVLVLDRAYFENTKSSSWFILATFACILGALGVIICTLLFAVFRWLPDNYAVVLDAGSTHSDLTLYKWPGQKINNTGEVTQVAECFINGGLAESKSDPAAYFGNCTEEIVSQIPEESKKTAEILMGATAGMRLLNLSDPVKSSKVVQSVKEYFGKSPIRIKENYFGIISGFDEGLAGWITINFLKDTIYSEINHHNASWGALDIGGASTQISYEVSPDRHKDPHVYKLQLFGRPFYVYSQSFLCFGRVQLRLRYHATIIMNNASGAFDEGLESPCDPQGRVIKLTSEDFKTPCIRQDDSHSSSTSLLQNNSTFTLTGTGDFEKCNIIIQKLLNISECRYSGWLYCLNSSADLSEVSSKKFMAVSSYFYTARGLGISGSSSVSTFVQKVQSACKMLYQEILEKQAKDSKKYRDFEYLCLNGVTVLNLLRQVYGFGVVIPFENILFAKKINTTSVGWTLGFMVNATDSIATGKSVPTLKSLPFGLLVVLFCLFLIISVIFFLQGLKNRNAAYERLPTFATL